LLLLGGENVGSTRGSGVANRSAISSECSDSRG